jgi:O-antigen/teichoic acid export membrane protein
VGIIRKQSIRGSILAYTGVLLGFVTVGLLWPKFLSPEQIGLLSLIVAISTIFVQVGSLGFLHAMNKYFTLFRDKQNNHNGFVFIMLVVLVIGTLLSVILVGILKPTLIEHNTAKSTLLTDYYYLIIPVFISILLYNFFDTYLKLLYDAVTGILLNELLLRIIFLLLLLSFIIISYDFSRFALLYSAAYCFPPIALILILIIRKDFSILPSRKILTRDLTKKMVNISLYGIIGGFGLIAISSIDKIMVNKMIDLHNTGVYSIAFLYGTIIIVPGRIIGKAATASISDGWKNNDLNLISSIYSKTCVTQFIIALFIFLLLWLNIDSILNIIPPVYSEGKYVIFFIALAYVIDMSTGVNGIVIVTSKYYRYHTFLVILLLILVVISNLIFIPLFGIIGAAMASAISLLFNNGARYLLLLVKFKMQPFNYRYLIVLSGAVLIYLVLKLISFESGNIYVNIFLVSSVSSVMFGIIVYFSKASEDINNRIETYWHYSIDLIKKIIRK